MNERIGGGFPNFEIISENNIFELLWQNRVGNSSPEKEIERNNIKNILMSSSFLEGTKLKDIFDIKENSDFELIMQKIKANTDSNNQELSDYIQVISILFQIKIERLESKKDELISKIEASKQDLIEVMELGIEINSEAIGRTQVTVEDSFDRKILTYKKAVEYLNSQNI